MTRGVTEEDDASAKSDADATASVSSRAGRSAGVGLFGRDASVAILAIIVVAVALRPGIVSIGPVLPAIRDAFGLSHASASLLTTIPDLLMGFLALPTPWLARRFGRDRVLLVALMVLCSATAGRAFATGTSALLLATAGVGAGIAVVGALMAGFIKGAFPAKAAVLMGIYATALSFGSTVSAAATGPLAVTSPYGWRFGTGIWSVLGLFAIAAWLLVVTRARRRGDVARVSEASVPLPLTNRTAWLVALFFAADNFLFYALLTWTAPMYREYGFSTTTAGLILASFTAFFMIANPVFGWLSRSEDRRAWLAACAALAATGLVSLALWPTAVPFVSIPLCAVGLGGGFTLGMTLPLDNTRGVEEANVWNAFVLTVGYLIAAGGPLSVGSLRDASSDFRPSIWILVGVASVMLALTPFLRPHRRRLPGLTL